MYYQRSIIPRDCLKRKVLSICTDIEWFPKTCSFVKEKKQTQNETRIQEEWVYP